MEGGSLWKKIGYPWSLATWLRDQSSVHFKCLAGAEILQLEVETSGKIETPCQKLETTFNFCTKGTKK